MLVTLYGDAKEAKSYLEGHYILQTDPVNKKPCWFNDKNAIWAGKSRGWMIGLKKNLGSGGCGIGSPDNVEDPLQALTWKYLNGDDWIKSKDILITRAGII